MRRELCSQVLPPLGLLSRRSHYILLFGRTCSKRKGHINSCRTSIAAGSLHTQPWAPALTSMASSAVCNMQLACDSKHIIAVKTHVPSSHSSADATTKTCIMT